eukprot:CAMPEP_0184487834 /NCGR_PEP_ID=MMETSP0113_2-20130426/10359_1 /TAXON_ID=91329 /ORGANISM="Norrisiella sphaerica, Strain BC52" /LENGTH=279 /DNA_ID=CAMNT_0026870245 /DNA_START=98 /DNA_END=937 /DNA_ORIENTATION=-
MNEENKAPTDTNKPSESKASEGPKLRQAEWQDINVGLSVYIRKKKAEVLRTDFPLIFWVYEGEKAEKHRSFTFDKEMFEVEDYKSAAKGGGLIGEPLCKTIKLIEDAEYDCVGVTPKHTVEITNCRRSCITVLGEVYGISMTNCTDVTLLFHSLRASCDILKCAGCKVFCMTECCLFDIQESENCKVAIGEKLLNTVLFSTIKTEKIAVESFEQVTPETVEMLRDGEDLERIVQYEIPISNDKQEEVEMRTKWNGQMFETKTVETKELSPDFDKEFDPF